MKYKKLNFKLNDRVTIHSLGGDELENENGYILGKSNENYIDHYIVMLDNPTDTHLAVIMPEVCLKQWYDPNSGLKSDKYLSDLS